MIFYILMTFNILNLVIVSIIGVIFNESLTLINKIGITLGLLSVVLIEA